PVLNAIYPPAIVLILLSCFQRWIGETRFVYPVAVGFTAVSSVAMAVLGVFREIPVVTGLLCWMIPAAVGVVLGLILSKALPPKKNAAA
ncbi:MAG: branched-chain amino acid transport system II carrier protein, partial [Oscillospiraceae bacterium]